MELKVSVSAPIRPTEDLSKVAKAIRYMIDRNYRRGAEPGNELDEEELRSALGNDEIVVSMPEFKDGAYTAGELSVTGGIELLKTIHHSIRQEEIIDTAYTALRKGMSDDECRTVISLNKQVAYARRLNFPADEETLGSIRVEIEAKSPESLERVIDWLTPPTKEGTPVYELSIEDLNLC